MKKKILILINSDIYIRNYLETDAFHRLYKNFKCYFIASSNDIYNKKKLIVKLKKKFVGFIKYHDFELKRFEKHLYKNFLLNKEKSKTISYLKKKFLVLNFIGLAKKSIWYYLNFQ